MHRQHVITEDQIKGLRSRLDAREAELRAQLEAGKAAQAPVQASHEAEHDAPDLGAQGDQRIRDAVRDAENKRAEAELHEIAAIKERLSQGDFGVCKDCGGGIALATLENKPSALRCATCQGNFDLAYPVGAAIPMQ